MIWPILVLHWWVWVSSMLGQDSMTNAGGWTVCVQLPRTVFLPDVPIVAIVTVSNASSVPGHLIWATTNPTGTGFGEFRITRNGSERVPVPVRRGAGLFGGDSASAEWLQPHEHKAFVFNLHHVFALDRPGSYCLCFAGQLNSSVKAVNKVAFQTPPLVFAITNRPPHESWLADKRVDSPGPVTQAFELSLRMPGADFRLGEPMAAIVSLRNLAPTNQMVRESSWGSGYELMLKNQDGTQLSLSAGAKRRMTEEHGWYDFSLSPQGERWREYRLDEWFEIKSPGTYTLQARLVSPPPIEYPGRPLITMPALVSGVATFTATK